MAQLSFHPQAPSPAAGGAPLLSGARLSLEQLRAVAWLRWRILANGFRRRGGAGELLARILLLPIFAAIAIGPTLLAGFAAFYFATNHQLGHVAWILWAAFALTQLLNINLGQPGTTFDPVELIRFPLPLWRYVLIRLCFGVLSPANMVVSLISVAVAVGLVWAAPTLLIPALLAMSLFAATNILFTRMVFAWVDRWLSTRRARELFTAVIFIASLGFQYVNVRFNPGFQHTGARHGVRYRPPPFHSFLAMERNLSWTPPELVANALRAADHHQTIPFILASASCATFAALFLTIFTLRMRTEYHGENLSDAAVATSSISAPQITALPTTLAPGPAPLSPTRTFRPSLGPLLAKELLVLRRNVGLFYGLIAPAVMVFLFAGRMSMQSGQRWVLFAAVAYSLLGISPMSYNAFGLEGTGAQLYFYAPLQLREVFFAKNVFALLVAAVEILVVIVVTSYVAGRPDPFSVLVVLLWAAGTLLLNTAIGNIRSISAPKRVNPGRTMNKAQSAVSSYIAIGIMLGCAALGLAADLVSTYLHQPWLLLAVSLAILAAGAVVYVQGLRGIETYAMDRREALFEELGKKT